MNNVWKCFIAGMGSWEDKKKPMLMLPKPFDNAETKQGLYFFFFARLFQILGLFDNYVPNPFFFLTAKKEGACEKKNKTTNI